MKDTVQPSFIEAARLIADGRTEDAQSDEVLASILARRAWFIGLKLEGRKTDLTPHRQMYKAADTLSRMLPVYDWMIAQEAGRAQIDVEATLATLETIKTDLAHVMKPSGRGKPPDTQRDYCAHIVVSLWKLVHGKVNPRSEKLYAACQAYWQASGGGPIGDISNWRTYVEKANRQVITPK
jgi:hypothetical protein